MGKRKALASGFGLRKCTKREQPIKDQISRLPNDILVHVLSFLTFKEAARTSVLSKRWIDLWMHVARLNFDGSEVLTNILLTEEVAKRRSSRERERHKYVEWVNNVLHLHQSLALDDFRIAFDFNIIYANEIDKWLQYAFARRVQKLELDLSPYGLFICNRPTPYTFPCEALGLSNEKSSDKARLPGYRDIHPSALIDFNALKSLSLKSLNVNGEVLECFLYKCPFLERLLVFDSSDLINLEVCGPSLALKYLEICRCRELKSITVRDANLISLKITAGHCLVLHNVPMLVDVWISGRSPDIVRDVSSWLSCCLSKLEFLTLCATQFDVSEVSLHLFSGILQKGKLHGLPQLTNLKQFTLLASASKDDSLIGFTSLITASPNLEKFVLKLEWRWSSSLVRGDRKLKKGIRFPLQHLKVVELLGYYGRRSELELVGYFLRNAVVLEKIIIDPRDQLTCVINPKTRKEIKQEKVAKKYAKQQLEGLIPSHVELIIQ